MTVAGDVRVASPVAELAPRSAMATIQRIAPLAAALVVFAVAAWAVAPYPVGIFHDDGVYLILAKSLATGNGYRYLHLPGAPLATHYPPVYPALLAVLWKIGPGFPGNLALLLLVNAALLAWTAASLARFARGRLHWNVPAAIVLALVATLSLPLLMLSTLLLSEVLCLALAIPLLGATEDALEDDGRRRLRDAALGAAAGLLVLVRAQALALPAAVLLLLLARRKWSRAGWYALGAAVLVAPWQLWVALHDAALAGPLHGSYGSYLGWYAHGLADGGISFVARTVRINVVAAGSLIADRVAPWPLGWMRIVPLLLALALMVAGAVRLRRRAPVTLGFMALYAAATLAWPYTPWRSLWAVWPLVLLLLAEGGVESFALASRQESTLWRAGVVTALGCLSLGIARAEIESYSTAAWRGPIANTRRQIAPIVRWVASHTRTDDVVIADQEPLVYLMTGRRAIAPASFTALEYVGRQSQDDAPERAIQMLLDQYHPRYLLTIVPTTRDAARALARNSRPALREIETLGDGTGAVFEGPRP